MTTVAGNKSVPRSEPTRRPAGSTAWPKGYLLGERSVVR